ncbi:MAG: hypothetical protein RLY97_867, partial [Pseudomonadota bacterium]
RRIERRDDHGWNNGRNNGWSNNGWNNSWNNNNNWRDNNRQWNRNWRHEDRFDWRDYRNDHRDYYRAGRYFAPYRGTNYSRLSIGFFLEPLFFRNDYWIADPWAYRLPPAYGPYRWVRYYDDVLLVNIYSGEVVDVIHDFFW